MKIAVVTLVLNQPEVTQRFLNTLRENESGANIPLLVVDNGSMPPVRDWLLGLREGDNVIRNGENEGVVKGMNQAWGVLKNVTDYILFIHNDVLIHEKGWDIKLGRLLEGLPDCGVAGFYGAKGIGTHDIYRTPYVMQQLIRVENVSNCNRMNPAIHGFRSIRKNEVTKGETEEVAVLDGFSLLVKTELLNKLEGFDRSLGPHHSYDNQLCLDSMNLGYRNFVLSMDADHLGGRTDVLEDWNKNFGKSKADIHKDSHIPLYEKWKPGKNKITLPIRVA